MTYNYKADQVRVWASIAVVLIHVTSYLPNFGRETLHNYYWYRPFLNIAVPFFFGVSGYLLANKGQAYIKPYIKGIGLKFMVYSLFYLMLDWLIQYFVDFDGLASLSRILQERTLYALINGTWGQYHLWFLFALMVSAYLFGWLRSKGFSSAYIFLASLALNLILWILPKNELVDQIFRYGGLLKGILYLSMGAFISDRPSNFPVGKWLVLFMGLVYALLFNFSPFKLLNEFGLIAVTYLLLKNVIDRPGHETWLNAWSALSLDIYVLHVLFLKLVRLYGESRLWAWFNSDLIYILVLLLICVVGSVLIQPLVDQLFFRPLRRALKILGQD